MNCRFRRIIVLASIVAALGVGTLSLTAPRADAAPLAQGCWGGPCPPPPDPWGSPPPGPWLGPPDPAAYADAVVFTDYVNLTNAIGYQNAVNATIYQNLANAAAYRNTVRVITYLTTNGR